jgi:hypothetical protein
MVPEAEETSRSPLAVFPSPLMAVTPRATPARLVSSSPIATQWLRSRFI